MSKYVIQCWSCGTRLNLDERDENDGDCIECGVELALDDYLDQAVTENESLRAELAALKAGQGEAVAWIVTDMNGDSYFAYDRQTPSDTPLYAAPPASADDRLVPVELLKRIAREADHYDDSPVATINDNCELWQIGHVRLKMTVGDLRELRALLAQSQEVK